jgi:hypothetical protein
MRPLHRLADFVVVPRSGISPLHSLSRLVRADSRRLLPCKEVTRHVWLVLWLFAGLAGLAPAVLAQPDTFYGNPDSYAFIRIPSDTDDWTRHFRIGVLLGMNISANFTRNGTFGISGNNPAQGIYDDGYVRTDNTGNAGGQTAYWGYDNASQLSGSILTMSAANSFTTSSSDKEQGGVFPGFDMAYGDNLWYWKHARVGWEFGFGLLPINITDNQSAPATVNQSTYTFSTGGIIVPQAPYQGSPNGGPFEPTIPTNYTSSAVLPPPNGIVSGSQSLDVMLYTFRLGPTFYWDLSDKVGMSLGAGPAVGFVSGDYKYDEVISANNISAHNSGKIGGTDFVYGGYFNAMVMYHAVENGDIYAGIQFMPMSNATISGGGRQGRLNLGGQVHFSIGVNWPF